MQAALRLIPGDKPEDEDPYTIWSSGRWPKPGPLPQRGEPGYDRWYRELYVRWAKERVKMIAEGFRP